MRNKKAKIRELKQQLELRCQELESALTANLTMQAYVQHRTDSQRKACELWQEGTGNKIAWPDAADLMHWLMEENENLRSQCQSLMQTRSSTNRPKADDPHEVYTLHQIDQMLLARGLSTSINEQSNM